MNRHLYVSAVDNNDPRIVWKDVVNVDLFSLIFHKYFHDLCYSFLLNGLALYNTSITKVKR